MKEKKGLMTLEFAIKMVIAIACIFLLIVFAFYIFGSIQKQNKIRQAEATLEGLIERTVLVYNEELDSSTFVYTGPEKVKERRLTHFLIYFYEQKKICICPLQTENRNFLDCFNEGICKEYSFSNIEFRYDESIKDLFKYKTREVKTGWILGPRTGNVIELDFSSKGGFVLVKTLPIQENICNTLSQETKVIDCPLVPFTIKITKEGENVIYTRER
jgi:hypothetical protein